jgi:hypothetical protein
MKPHKWHKEIKAWADGAEIEVFDIRTGEWAVEPNPHFYENVYQLEYRIKPQPKEPQYLYVWLDKDTDLAQLETHKPEGVLDDGVYKYIGKIKLEVDDVPSNV